jgi:hypothetical protein
LDEIGERRELIAQITQKMEGAKGGEGVLILKFARRFVDCARISRIGFEMMEWE